MTGRETLGLAPGDRVTLDAIKAMVRLDASMVGVHVRHTGEVVVLPIGNDGYFDALGSLYEQEPILELTTAEVVDFWVWCCGLVRVDAGNMTAMQRANATIWERLRVDFADKPQR